MFSVASVANSWTVRSPKPVALLGSIASGIA